MSAGNESGATAGKQKRGSRPPKKHQPKGSISFGNSSSIRDLRAGQTVALREEDWNFSELADRATLIAACFYEYGRESQHVPATAQRWLELQAMRQRLLPFVREIVTRCTDNGEQLLPEKITITLTNSEGVAETVLSSWALTRDTRLPCELCDEFAALHSAEHEMQTIESHAGVGAPRLRTLAQHISEDTPWLQLPTEDRKSAIDSAFQSRFEVPRAAHKMTCFRIVPGIERVAWGDFDPPPFSHEQVRRNEHSDYRHMTSASDEVVPTVIRWGKFSDKRIIDDFRTFLRLNRPEQWKGLAKRSGRDKTNFWKAALKELGAMRLSHACAPEEAWTRFQQSFAVGEQFDQPAFARLRRNALMVFAHFFPFGEEPRHWVTYTARQRR